MLEGATLLGRYRVHTLIGQGGMALVYSGRHLVLDCEVAIKVLRHRLARKQSVVDRFLQEARAASRVRHPHIVEVTDFGTTPAGVVFMVMERLEGETLADTILRDGRLSWPRVRAIALQLCDALQTVHDAGVVHRDISLKNFFRLSLGKNPDFVKVLDFGIARMTAQDSRDATPIRRLTSDTQIMGTPEFMSPEQATRSGAGDARSDIYAMGVVLYAMLTAKMPFEAETAIDMMAKHIYEPVPPPSVRVASIARDVEAVVLRALEKDPDRRFQTMAELAEALASIPEDAQRPIEAPVAAPVPDRASVPTPPRPRWRGARRLATVGAVGSLAWFGWADGERFVERAAAMAGIESIDLLTLPVPDVANDVVEPEIAPASLLSVAAAPTTTAAPIEAPPIAAPTITRPPPVLGAEEPPAPAHTMTLPPGPAPGWLDPPRRKRPRASAARPVVRSTAQPGEEPAIATAAEAEPSATPLDAAAAPAIDVPEPQRAARADATNDPIAP